MTPFSGGLNGDDFFPTDVVRAWKKSTALDRVEACVMMLRIHGFMSDRERQAVLKRIEKWVLSYGKKQGK